MWPRSRRDKNTGALHNSSNLQVKIIPFLNAISVNSDDFFKSHLVKLWDHGVLFKSVPLTQKNRHITGLLFRGRCFKIFPKT